MIDVKRAARIVFRLVPLKKAAIVQSFKHFGMIEHIGKETARRAISFSGLLPIDGKVDRIVTGLYLIYNNTHYGSNNSYV